MHSTRPEPKNKLSDFLFYVCLSAGWAIGSVPRPRRAFSPVEHSFLSESPTKTTVLVICLVKKPEPQAGEKTRGLIAAPLGVDGRLNFQTAFLHYIDWVYGSVKSA